MNLALILAGMAGTLIIGFIVLAAVLGWGGAMTTLQRLGLCATAAGLVGAAISRTMQQPVGWFDVLFLAGLGLYLARTYGPAVLKRADACDGVPDGQIHFPTRR